MAIVMFKSPNLESRSIEKLKTCPELTWLCKHGMVSQAFVSHQCSFHNNRKVEEMWKRRRKIKLASIAKASAKTTKLINGCFLLGTDFFIRRNIQGRRKHEEPKNMSVAGAEFCIMSCVFFLLIGEKRVGGEVQFLVVSSDSQSPPAQPYST